MIRLATCFSGIGAIEHALNRMSIDNEIVFACDNGDVDILSKKIKLDVAEIDKEFLELKKIIGRIQDDDYKEILEAELNRDHKLYENQKRELEKVDIKIKGALMQIFSNVLKMDNISKKRIKEYTNFAKNLSQMDGINARLYTLFYAVEVTNDFHKDNMWESLKDDDFKYNSSDNIDWNIVKTELNKTYSMIDDINGRRILKKTRDICERLGMLHEKIVTLEIIKKLKAMDSYDEKKAYVDSLYKEREINNKVKKSYLANYKLAERHFHWNVSFLDGLEYRDKVDLFVGGSPCQSFSLVGKQRGLEDTRGTLFYEYARLVKEIRPKIFIYENVRAILSNDEGRTWQVMQDVFTSLDYTWDYQILNAKDYGIPQNRERVFVVGFRNDLRLKEKFSFPKPFELKSFMKDYLLDNVSGKYYLPKKGVDFVTSDKNLTKRYTQIDGDIALCQKKNQQFNWHGDFVFEEECKNKEKTMQDLEKYFLSEKVRKY
nr:DNA (cytosine-5-)-methyltransferase [Parasporobacterium sp.]